MDVGLKSIDFGKTDGKSEAEKDNFLSLFYNDNMITELIRENGGEYNYSQLVEEFQVGMGWDQKYLRRSGF